MKLSPSPSSSLSTIFTFTSIFQCNYYHWCAITNLYFTFTTHLTLDTLEPQIFQFREPKPTDYLYSGLMNLGIIIIIYLLLLTRFGFHGVQAILFLLPGLLMVITITFQKLLPILTEYDWFDLRLLLLPSTFFRASQVIISILPPMIWFHSLQTLPTEIRAIGFTLVYGSGILGKLAAPNLIVLGEMYDSSIAIGLCGLSCLIAGGLSFVFPKRCETLSFVGSPCISRSKFLSTPTSDELMDSQSIDDSHVHRHIQTNRTKNRVTRTLTEPSELSLQCSTESYLVDENDEETNTIYVVNVN